MRVTAPIQHVYALRATKVDSQYTTLQNTWVDMRHCFCCAQPKNIVRKQVENDYNLVSHFVSFMPVFCPSYQCGTQSFGRSAVQKTINEHIIVFHADMCDTRISKKCENIIFSGLCFYALALVVFQQSHSANKNAKKRDPTVASRRPPCPLPSQNKEERGPAAAADRFLSGHAINPRPSSSLAPLSRPKRATPEGRIGQGQHKRRRCSTEKLSRGSKSRIQGVACQRMDIFYHYRRNSANCYMDSTDRESSRRTLI